MCINYRRLNSLTTKNRYPLPKIQDCLDAFAKAVYFSKLDLTLGFWQLLIEEDSIAKIAFNTIEGKFEFLVMLFSLTNALATFQTLMNGILRPYLFKVIVVYLDDIVIYSKTLEEHLEHLETILDLLVLYKLYASPLKCSIAVMEINFYRHRVKYNQILLIEDKIVIIKKQPTPKTVYKVRQFLGLASYYRRYIRGFAKIAAPLSDLLKEKDKALRKKKHRPITWNA